MNTLASTAQFHIGGWVDVDDNTLVKINQILTQLIVLVSILVIIWQKVESVVYLLSDIFTAIDYIVRVMAIIVNTVRFAL